MAVHPHTGRWWIGPSPGLAVALVAAAVVLMAVVSDAATVPPLGLDQRPVVTTVITLSAVPDPRATEGTAPTRPAADGVMVKQERLARGPHANDARSGIGAHDRA